MEKISKLETQNQKKKNSDFFLKMHLENSQKFQKKMSLENSPNSDSKEKNLSLENSSNSGSKSLNSFVPEKNELEKKNKLRGSEVLKISNVKVQIHFLLKTMDTKKKPQRLRLSPVWVQKVARVSREQNFATRKQ